jgi:hypothetical protein
MSPSDTNYASSRFDNVYNERCPLKIFSRRQSVTEIVFGLDSLFSETFLFQNDVVFSHSH